MNKLKYILGVSCVALSLVSCEDFFDKQIGNDYHITDVRTMEYTLTADDYKTISKNSANQAIAVAIDSATLQALTDMGKDGAFNDEISADVYVPAFLSANYPNLSDGSIINVTYALREGKSNRVVPFASATGYTMTTDDYKLIWGGKGAAYVTNATEDSISSFLSQKFPTAQVGKIVVLNYAFSEFEPSTITPDLPYVCTVGQLLAAQETGVEHQLTGIVGQVKSSIYGRFYLVDGADSIYVYGLTDDQGNKVWKAQGLKQGDQITVTGKYALVNDEPQLTGAVYVSHVASAPARVAANETHTLEARSAIYQLTAAGWVVYADDALTAAVALPAAVQTAVGGSVSDPQATIGKFLEVNYPYAQAKEVYLVAYRGKSGMTADEFTYDGSTFVMNTGVVTDVMSFARSNAKWAADISTYYKQAIMGEGQGKLVIQNVSLSEGITYIWSYAASYGMKGTSYSSGAHEGEAWVVTPAIKLKNAVAPALNFDEAINYGPDALEDRTHQCGVFVSTDYSGDVTTCTWTQLEIPVMEDGMSTGFPTANSWTFYNTGEIDLSAYANQKIYLGFRYKAEAGMTCSTWEFKNLLVHEVVAEETAE